MIPKTYAYTDLSAKGALALNIGGADGFDFDVAQFNAGFALNEIPMAQCALAVGRDAQSQNAATPATIHKIGANKFLTMTPATVTFTPSGEYAPDGTLWPEGPQVIFTGYFMGFAQRKSMGKITVTASLVHWLVDLGCSSACGQNMHVANPPQLNTAAVMQAINSTGASAPGVNISRLFPYGLIKSDVSSDLWKAIKSVFCSFAGLKTQSCGPEDVCGGIGGEGYVANTRAMRALKMMEGNTIEGDTIDPDTLESTGCDFQSLDVDTNGYRYGVPLAFDIFDSANKAIDIPDIIASTIAETIGGEMIENYSSVTFWDKLIGGFCPTYGLAVVPMVSRALVIADTPAYNGGPNQGAVWKEIQPTEYDDADFSSVLDRPLRAVGVVATWFQDTVNTGERGRALPVHGGCYVEESVAVDDGIVQFVNEPPWLQCSRSTGSYGAQSTGSKGDIATKAAGASADGPDPLPDSETMFTNLDAVYQAYAQTVYANTMLRGRQGAFAGKLRFDIAPGSNIRIVSSSEAFLANDALGIDLYGCVQRVTISINAETGTAGTGFVVSHLRTAEENTKPRTSVSRHPLFGTAIHGGGKHGAPLVPAYDLNPETDEVEN